MTATMFLTMCVLFLLAVPVLSGYLAYQVTVHGLPNWLPLR